MVLTARDLSRLEEVEKEIRESHPNTKVLVHKTDVTSEADVKAAFTKAIEAFGSVDIAIHNAGLNSDFHSSNSDGHERLVEPICKWKQPS